MTTIDLPLSAREDVNGYRVTVFRDPLAVLGTRWHAGPDDDLFLTAPWFETVAHCGPMRPARYVVSDEDGEACALFAADGSRPFMRRLISLTNFYTMRFAPIIRPDALGSLDALARAIAAERPRWAAVELRCLVANDPITRCLVDSFRYAGFITSTYFQAENWYCHTRGMSAQGYFSERPSLRDRIARETRRLRKKHQSSFRLYRTANELPEGLGAYEAVYARSWKEREQFPKFIPALLRMAAENGALRLGVLYVDGNPVAAQLWLLSQGRATIYKLAYDDAYSKLSVGSILSKMMFEHVLENDRPDEIDYGTGSDAYKRDWMNQHRSLIGMIAYNPRTLGGVVGIGLAAARSAVRRIKTAAAAGRMTTTGTAQGQPPVDR